MQFRLFGSASARRGRGEVDRTEGYHDFIEYNVEAKASVEINLDSAIYGPPDEIARKIEALQEAGAGYVVLKGGASGGGERDRNSLRRFAREVMPGFAT